jgi:hypothetical protein
MTMMRLPHAALGGVTIGASMRLRYRLSTRVPAGGARGQRGRGQRVSRAGGAAWHARA